MQYSSGLPAWFVAAFANAGDKNTIPATATVTGAAALNTGWPSICSLPEEAGGIAITREDLNGILYWLSHSIQRLQAGGFMPYDATFAAAIGGYPKGALVRKADGTGYWMNEADSNTTDPDGGSPANWIDSGVAAAVLLTGNQTVSGFKTFAGGADFTDGICYVKGGTDDFHAAATYQAFGVLYNWASVIGSRSLGVTYTNPFSDKALGVMIVFRDSGAGGAPTLTIGGISTTIGTDLTTNNGIPLTIVIPPLTTYSLSATGATLISWWEAQ